jgi:membrane fusion protein (multidrug efflux system)
MARQSCVVVVFDSPAFEYPRNRMSFSRSSLTDFSTSLPARPLWLAGVLSAFLLAGCGQGNKDAAAAAPPPLAQVGVVTVALSDIGLTTELPGRLEASRVAQVRARAAGILQKRLFSEGSDVKAGEALFSIDSAPYAAAYASAQASLARAQANLEQATSLAQRYQPLVKANAVSKQEFANAEAAQKQAEADVAVGKAAVQTAKITLDYATVTAPISGRIGRALVTEGALVGQGEFTQLAVIQQTNPMYINFTQPAAEVMKLRKALEAGQLKRASGDEAVRVRLVLEDGSVYAQSGRGWFSDF